MLPDGPLDQLEDLLERTKQELDILNTNPFADQDLANILDEIRYHIGNAMKVIQNIRNS
ncbi:MAG: hypothetical protein VKN72_23060 [Nostocales cyanobacterium 94392]|nr:hypothetical protein [Nostocales cyanobacterium 94392]